MELILASLVLIAVVVYGLVQILEWTRAFADRRRDEGRVRTLATLTGSPLDTVDDPREAGMVVLMLAIGREPSHVQLGAIEWVAREMMGSDAPQALIARGRWLSGLAREPRAAIERMFAVLDHFLEPQERRAFMAAVSEIAGAEERVPADVAQGFVLARFSGRGD